MWRTTPLHRHERAGSAERNGPPPLPAGTSQDDLQLGEHGAGPLFHRRYRGRIRNTQLTPNELMAALSSDPNRAAPTEFARFTKVHGAPDLMRTGDEFVVRMPGPWDGPVRVISLTPTSFRLATLDGHLEAGQIEFRASCDNGDLDFIIESWARSGDRLSAAFYGKLRMAKEVQLHMWTSFVEQVARVAGGRLAGGISIDTWHVAMDEKPNPASDPGVRRVLDALHDKPLNFDPGARRDLTPDNGWLVDSYCQRLPCEPPGDPVSGGAWEIACRLMRNYEFADPDIVRAVYADGDLEGRDMLLVVRFHGLRFHLGVRVGGVIDETRSVDGRPVRVWGWSYRTLQGHLEKGQMDYEVWKWLDTGDVEFRVCRFSRPAEISNPIVRLGFRLFGRREQIRFAEHACERMARLTAAALDDPGDAN